MKKRFFIIAALLCAFSFICFAADNMNGHGAEDHTAVYSEAGAMNHFFVESINAFIVYVSSITADAESMEYPPKI